jgi:RNA polymerase sigma-70 factor (ECF subfamily)
MYSRDTEEAKDILQEGFIKIFQKLEQYSGKGSFEGWMRRIFINSALERYRVKQSVFMVDKDMEVLAGEVDENINDQLSANDLLDMIRDLSPQYRMVFNLYAIEGYSHKEISKKLNISEGTSKSNLSRARSILQDKLTKLHKRELGENRNAK